MKTSKGFTLIELMITVAVVAVLASVAYPSYTAYILRGRIAEGTSALSDGRVKMEQFFQDNRTYVGGPAPLATSNFTYTAADRTLTTYTLVATGTNDLAGFTFTINQNNIKSTTAPASWTSATMPAACWITKKNGAC